MINGELNYNGIFMHIFFLAFLPATMKHTHTNTLYYNILYITLSRYAKSIFNIFKHLIFCKMTRMPCISTA